MKAMMTAASFCLRTSPASAASELGGQQGISGRLKTGRGRSLLLNFLQKHPGSRQRRVQLQKLGALFLSVFLMLPAGAACEELDWSIGAYAGQYYDTEPAGIIKGKGNFLNQYIVAVTASKTIWRSESLPLALEIDGMIGHQYGTATLQEFAIAPVLRWSGFPWNEALPTSFRFGPLGYSYTTVVSPLERGPSGEGTRHLNFLMAELTFSGPRSRSHEVFVRLHHRCTIEDLLNNYGANGEDFLALGYRRFF